MIDILGWGSFHNWCVCVCILTSSFGVNTSLEISGGTEDAPTYSVSIEGSGDLTQNAV